MSLVDVWEGKQKKFEQIGYVVLVVFEVQFLYANLVQVWDQQYLRVLWQLVWQFYAGLGSEVQVSQSWFCGA